MHGMMTARKAVQQPTANSQQPPLPVDFPYGQRAFLAGYFHKRDLRGEDILDAVQTVFLRCLEAVRKGTLIREPKPFVTCIARRTWAGIVRKRGTAAPVVYGLPDAEPAARIPEDEGDPAPEEIEVLDLLKAIQLLPPRQREIVNARYFREMRPQQIAAELGMKANAVSQRHTEAIRRLAVVVPLLAKERAARRAAG